jgi:hypothetical protein
MPKLINIEAKTRSGERGVVQKMYPQNLKEAVEMWGERDTFESAVKTHIIIDQREARPVDETVNGDETPKPKKRLSVHDRLAAE